MTVTVVAPAIDAVDDSVGGVNGTSGAQDVVNAYANDTLNGTPVNPAEITGTVTAPATPINGGPVPVLDPATGLVDVPAGTPAGNYTITYQICETLNPSNCDTATVTVAVVAAPIVADNDNPPLIVGTDGGTTPSVLDNDTLDGRPVTVDNVILTPGTSPAPGLTMNPDGTITVAPGTPAGTYQYPYTLCERLNPGNCDTAVAIVVVEAGVTEVRMTKTASPRNVKVGDLVRYTVVAENIGEAPVVDGTVIDTPPAGFSYVDGSLVVADADALGRLAGTFPIRVDQIDIPVGGRATITYLLRVGAGVRAGVHTNSAVMEDNGERVSNVATAEVQLVADPLMDESLILGTVFDDRDADGWQDSAIATGVRVQGGFAPEAYIANSTTVDDGTGPRPEADHSSPLLHGISLVKLDGRQSEADPVQAHGVLIRQKLNALAFTDDFTLVTDQGVTVRMDAAGNTRVEKAGDAAKGLNAADLRVERKVSQAADGYVVDYIVSNAGIDERGIPGVRIASVEGLIVETDQFGRYHLAGVDGGRQERGRNFILKVDPATLPPGSTPTTDNPLLRRVTPGLPTRFDFGFKLPPGLVEGPTEMVEMQLGEVLFAPGSAEVRAQYQPVIDKMADKVREHQGGEVVIDANGETRALAFERAEAVKAALVGKLDEATAKVLRVVVRGNPDDPGSLIAGVGNGGALLGTVLFDTDKSTIRPEFEPLLDKVAASLERMGGGVIGIVGHTDVRASFDYNTALGMRRAKAVADALSKRLSPEVRAKLRVESSNDPAAPVGMWK